MIATKPGMFRGKPAGGGLAPKNDIRVSNIFTDFTSGIQTVSASSTLSVYAAWRAYDDVVGTPTNSWISPDGSLPAWNMIDFGEATTVYSSSLRGREALYVQTDFTVESSDDGVVWSTVLTVTGNTDFNEIVRLHTTPVSARYFRHLITAQSGHKTTRADVGEIKYFS